MRDLNSVKLKLLIALERRAVLDELKNTRDLKKKEKLAWQLLSKQPLGCYCTLVPQLAGQIRQGDSNANYNAYRSNI